MWDFCAGLAFAVMISAFGLLSIRSFISPPPTEAFLATTADIIKAGPGELYYGCKDLPRSQKYLCAHAMKCCERVINVSDLSAVPPDLVYTSYPFYATIDLCGQIFLGVGRTWTPIQAGMLPAYSDDDGRNDFTSSATQAMILLQRFGATLTANLRRVCQLLST